MKRKIQEIKNRISRLDWVLVGTVLKNYKQCGKPYCRCLKGGKYRHGPYYIWTRKEKGKTITKTLTLKQTQCCRKAFWNMKRINRFLEVWKKLSLEYIAQIT